VVRRDLGLAVLLFAITLVVARSPKPAPATRMAIRVAENAFAESLALDVWSEERGPGLPLDLVVTPAALPLLDGAGVAYEVLDPDIDASARAEHERLQKPGPKEFFAEYRDYTAIGEHLRSLALLAPDRVAIQAIGASVDGRPIWAVRIGNGGTKMLVNGTEHAREWLSAMATTCVADRIVRDYATDPQIRAFADTHELWVVPVSNPDGYQYAWTSDRYWRKNRRGSHGVDLNRNFSVGWGGEGSGKSKRSETYRGEYAFSEPESIALRDLVKREQITHHVDFHTYSQLVLYPWGYTRTPAPDRARFAAIGDRMASAIFATHRNAYKLIQSSELYPAGGTMSDWMYGEAGAQSFTIELRPGEWPGRGRGGFAPPPEEIRPTCDEALAAVLASELRQ
jgi:carboxypeptidase T